MNIYKTEKKNRADGRNIDTVRETNMTGNHNIPTIIISPRARIVKRNEART